VVKNAVAAEMPAAIKVDSNDMDVNADVDIIEKKPIPATTAESSAACKTGSLIGSGTSVRFMQLYREDADKKDLTRLSAAAAKRCRIASLASGIPRP
jgi:hypothetical protein